MSYSERVIPNNTAGLNLKNVTKLFGAQVAINNINLEFSKGEFVLLLGANGSGKSTLLKIIAGLIRPEKGELSYDSYKLGIGYLKKLSYLGHTSGLYAPLSVIENFRIFSNYPDKIESLLREWGLLDHHEKKIENLSKGNEFRAALALTLHSNKEIRLLDEPGSALDQNGRKTFLNKLEDTQTDSNITIIVTHDPRHFYALANRIVVIKDGGVCQDTKGRFSESELADIYVEACNR